MTYKPTMKEAILITRVERGDLEAIVELWPIWFDEPLDQTRSFDDITDEFTAKATELLADDKNYEQPEPDLNASLLAATEAVTNVITVIIEDSKKKRSGRGFR